MGDPVPWRSPGAPTRPFAIRPDGPPLNSVAARPFQLTARSPAPEGRKFGLQRESTMQEIFLSDMQEMGLFGVAQELGVISPGGSPSKSGPEKLTHQPGVLSDKRLPASTPSAGGIGGNHIVAASPGYAVGQGNRTTMVPFGGPSRADSGSMGSFSHGSDAHEPDYQTNPHSAAARLRYMEETAGDGGESPDLSKKRKRPVRGDKWGKGLRHFSMKVCEKVESKGRTTYNEVADELVAEFSNPENYPPSGEQPYDEKNIRRRVYDALNVLMAMDIISKEKKEIQWKGLPSTAVTNTEALKLEKYNTIARVEKKMAFLQELAEQHTSFSNLVDRNKAEHTEQSGQDAGGVALPFILVQTQPNATVEVEISEDMHLVHFDFNNAPFEIHDDNYVLKSMGLHQRPDMEPDSQPGPPEAEGAQPGPGPRRPLAGGERQVQTNCQRIVQPLERGQPLPQPNGFYHHSPNVVKREKG